jgi:hypothetical protein
MKNIALCTGESVMVDDEDFERLSAYRWRRMTSSSGGKYAMTSLPRPPGIRKSGKTVMMHRIVMNAPKGMQVDHINGNALDNRKENLRLLEGTRNLRAFRRKKPNATSRYMGVSFSKNGWEVKCTFRKDGILHKIHVGRFKSEVEAALAYNRAAIQYGYLPEALNKVEAA